MRPLHLTQPDEATTLAMENELLRLEVVHVRARLLASDAELRRLEKLSSGATTGTATGTTTGAPPPTATGNGEGPPAAGQPGESANDDALADLQWLLRRIEATPLARVLGRRDGYRRLVDTYLREDAG